MRNSILVLGLLSMGLVAGWCGRALTPALARPRAVEPRGPLPDWEQVPIRRFKEAAPSVVYITTTEERSRDFFGLDVVEVPAGSGTGFIWDTEGHVVTNFHVIQGAVRATITLADGSRHEASYVGGAPDKDLAVLQLARTPPHLRPIPLGTSADLQVGQTVLAIGNPFGLDQTLTTGVVSALGREIQSVTRRRIAGVIQTDAAINPGNSGGPLLNSRGEVIGITTLIASAGADQSAGIGFAIPINTAKAVLDDFAKYGRVRRPSLDIVTLPIGPDIAEQIGLPADYGILIERVLPGGAAEKAGLHGGTQRLYQGNTPVMLGGDLIVAIDGQEVTDPQDINAIMDKHQAGDTISVTILRARRQITLKLILGEAREANT